MLILPQQQPNSHSLIQRKSQGVGRTVPMRLRFPILFLVFFYVLCTPDISRAFNVPDPCPCGPIGGPYEDYSPSSKQKSSPPLPRPNTPSKRTKSLDKARKKAAQQLHREIIKVRLEKSPSISVDDDYENIYMVVNAVPLGVSMPDRTRRATTVGAKRPSGYRSRSTSISTQNLRHSIAIMGMLFNKQGAFLEDVSNEDAKFLAEQIGFAMFGAPLQVYIPDIEEPQLTREQTDRVQNMVNKMEKNMVEIDRLSEQRVTIEKKLAKFEKELRMNSGDYTAFLRLDIEHKNIVKKEKAAHSELMNTQTESKKIIKEIIDLSVGLD